MNQVNVHEVDLQTASGVAEDSIRLDGIFNHLRATGDLGRAFSLIGQEMGLQPQVRFRVVLEGKSQLLYPLVYEHAYRIGREALLNTFRHSRASRIDLHLAYTPKELCLIIRDNGQGIGADSVSLGCEGLSWMRTLAERIGATLKLLSRASAGTEVLLSIPGQIAYSAETKTHCQAAA
jgi:signal transduction histidine kinase